MMIHYNIVHYIVWIVKHFSSIFSVFRYKKVWGCTEVSVQPFLYLTLQADLSQHTGRYPKKMQSAARMSHAHTHHPGGRYTP